MPQTDSLPDFLLLDQVKHALHEDLGGAGDVTSQAVIPDGTTYHAKLNAREAGVLSGMQIARIAFHTVDPSLVVRTLIGDGAPCKPGDICMTIEGDAKAILMAERVALNFAGRLSGIATMTAAYSAQAARTKTKITCTRKTTPGLRAFERYAVRCGRGHNHREDLGAAVLIKDNHIAAAGGVRESIERARAYAPHTCRIECEVDTPGQLQEALAAGADIVMLDNFDDEQVRDAVSLVGGRALVEVSGGITLDRVARLGALGVDVISVGALTHSSPSCDLGLDWG